MRIAYLGNQLTSGGGATSLFLMLRSLKNEPIKKFVWLSQINSIAMQKELEEFCEEVSLIGIEDITSCQTKCASAAHMKRVQDRMKGVDELIERLKVHKIEILHVNNSVFTHIYKRVKQETDVKIVSHVREWVTFGGLGEVQKFILRQIEQYSDAIIAISPTEADMFSHRAIHIIANPFDFKELAQNLGQNEYSPKSSSVKFNIGMVARPSLSKGHIEFLQALDILMKDSEINTSYIFTIIGLTKPRLTLRKFAKRLLGREPYYTVHQFVAKNGLQAHVKIEPYQEKIQRKVNQFDIVVRPSKFGDPWGRDVIEAMALEKPVVAFGDSTYFIEDGVTGYLVPRGDVSQLAEKLKRLITNPELIIGMGRKAKERIKPMVDIEGYNDKVVMVYDSLIPS